MAIVRKGGRYPWIVLVGPDGVGKTTVARCLVKKTNARYTHFLPRFRFDSLDPDKPTGSRTVGAAGPTIGSTAILAVRVAQSWLLYWLMIRPALERSPVISERWILGYIAETGALGRQAPAALTELLVGLTPQPDKVVLLTGKPSATNARKRGLREAEIDIIQSRYRRLRAWFSLAEFDTSTLSPAEVVQAIEDQLDTETVVAYAPPKRGAQWTASYETNDRRVLDLPFSPRARAVMAIWRRLARILPNLRRRVSAWPAGFPPSWRERLTRDGYDFLALYLPEQFTGRDRESWFFGKRDSMNIIQVKVRRGANSRHELSRESQILERVGRLDSAVLVYPRVLHASFEPVRGFLMLETPVFPSADRRPLTVPELIELVKTIQLVDPTEGGEALQGYASHGDLAPWNAWMSNDVPVVIDWESFTRRRSAVFDVVFYVITLRHSGLDAPAPAKLLEWVDRSELMAACDEISEVGPEDYAPHIQWLRNALDDQQTA